MRPLNRLGWLLACLVLASCAIAQDAEEVTIGVEKVVDGVYMLTGRGGNLGLAVGDDGAFLIDDQYAPLSDKIRSAVESVSKTPLRFIVNTHWHGDHTGGNENLGSGGVTILAHDNVRQRMSVEQVMEVFDLTTPPSPTAALPVITFPDRITFHMNGLEIETLHVPAAHTDGDSMIFFKGINVIHMGDVYFNGGYPFIDAGSGGTIDGVIAAVKTVLERSDADTRIIPGHGTLSTPKELREYLAMLEGTRTAILKEIQAGKSREETVAANPTAPFDEIWGNGFMKPDVFTGLVYQTLN